jgi:probable F420-dependent oxidoreductase
VDAWSHPAQRERAKLVQFNLELPGMHRIPGIDHPWSDSLEAPDFQRVAQVAEELGFVSILSSEHLALPSFEVPRLGSHWPHAPTVMAFVAGATQRIRVDAFLLVLPYHHPVALAKAIATLDLLSGGRVDLSIGVGHAEQEFNVLGVPFHERGRYTDEQLQVIKACWTSDEPVYHGTYFNVEGVTFAPKCVQRPYPPVLVGGNSKAALRRAARHDGWLPNPDRTTENRHTGGSGSMTLGLDDIPAMLDYIKAQPEHAARQTPFTVSLPIRTHPATPPSFRRASTTELNHFSDELHQTLFQMEDVGITTTWLPTPAVADLEEYLDYLRWTAEAVIANFPARAGEGDSLSQ